MKKIILVFAYFLFNFGFSQVQIGPNIFSSTPLENNFGAVLSISLDGNVVAITAGNNDGSGFVQVYRNNSGNWEQVGSDINGEFPNDLLGSSLDLNSDGSIIAVGSPGNDNNGIDSGNVKIFRNVNNEWEQIGSDINGEVQGDSFGYSLSLNSSGDIIVIGAVGNDGNGFSSGHVKIFRNINDTWQQIGTNINGENSRDFSGTSLGISLDGDIIAIGSPGNNGNGDGAGHVRIFRNNNDIWEQIGLDINGEAEGDFLGRVNSITLSQDGNTLATGVASNSLSNNLSGRVRVFQNISENWTEQGLINGELDNDRFGTSLSLSGDGRKIAVGSPQRGDAFNGYGQIFDLGNILSTNNSASGVTFSILPNPTKERFLINLDENVELKKVNIYNQLGQNVLTSKKKSVEVQNLSNGIYFVEVMTSLGKSRQKLVVN